MPRKVRDVQAGLLKKGFVRKDSKDAHFHLWVNGKKTPVYTMVSQGEKEIHDGLLATMARQVKLSGREFADLLECPLSAETYESMLRERGHIE
jgi:predicted RNA binding protein YcfA (HicA-like mRNA interferase family)